MFWALVYFLAIPTFSIIYYRMDRAFYQNTLPLEVAYSADSKRGAQEICKTYHDKMDDYSGRKIKYGSDIWQIESNNGNLKCPDELTVLPDASLVWRGAEIFTILPQKVAGLKEKMEMSYDANLTLTIQPLYQTSEADHDGTVQLPITIKVELPTAVFIRHEEEPQGNPLGRGFKKEYERPSRSSIIEIVFSQIFGGVLDFKAAFDGGDFQFEPDQWENGLSPLSQEEAYYLDFPKEYAKDLARLQNSSKGFTSDVSDNFTRMIYLSATVITTLGFGDIVPVTTTARLLVTLEAVLGIIFAGLFLNSIVMSRSNR